MRGRDADWWSAGGDYEHGWAWGDKRAGREIMELSPAITQTVNKCLD